MKKAYTITPAQYKTKQYEINRIGYNNGWMLETGEWKLSDDTNPRTRKHFENLVKECEEMPKPKNKVFFRGTDIYNLWLNRHSDEPVTARELYNIVESIAEAISEAESRATRSAADWD